MEVNKHASIYKHLGCNTLYINSRDIEFKFNKDNFGGNKQIRLGDFLMWAIAYQQIPSCCVLHTVRALLPSMEANTAWQ